MEFQPNIRFRINDETHSMDPCAKLREQVAMQERWLNRWLDAARKLLEGDQEEMERLVDVMEFTEALIHRNHNPGEEAEAMVQAAIDKLKYPDLLDDLLRPE